MDRKMNKLTFVSILLQGKQEILPHLDMEARETCFQLRKHYNRSCCSARGYVVWHFSKSQTVSFFLQKIIVDCPKSFFHLMGALLIIRTFVNVNALQVMRQS